MFIKVSAPGKVILHGEHAVVYGKSAVAASVNLRSHLQLSLNEQGKVDIDLPAVGLKRSWLVREIAEAVKIHNDVSMCNDGIEISDELRSSVTTLIGADNGSQKEELALTTFLLLYTAICSRNGNLPALDMKIQSEIPIGAGLGSSASLSVCLVTALLLQQGLITEPKQDPKGQEWSEKDLDLINKWAFEGEKIMHGRPSGIDNSVATFGGAIKFQGGKITKLEKMPSLRILLINTRIPRNTKDLVAGVRDKYTKYQDIIQPVLDSIEAVSLRCQAHFSAMVGVDQLEPHYKQLEELIDFNQHLLQVLGVSHPTIDKICQITSKYGCHSKLTGAGGGGCCFTLLRPDTSDDILDKIKRELTEENLDCWETTLGGQGVQASVSTT